MDEILIKIIEEIAENLDCGSDSYYNSKRNELISIPSYLHEFDQKQFEQIFKDDLDKINQRKSDFIKIKV